MYVDMKLNQSRHDSDVSRWLNVFYCNLESFFHVSRSPMDLHPANISCWPRSKVGSAPVMKIIERYHSRNVCPQQIPLASKAVTAVHERGR